MWLSPDWQGPQEGISSTHNPPHTLPLLVQPACGPHTRGHGGITTVR